MNGVLAFLRETAWVAYAIYFKPTALEAHLRARLRDVTPRENLTRLSNIVDKLDQPAARRYLAQLALLCALAAAPLGWLAPRAAEPPGLGALGLTYLLLVLGGLVLGPLTVLVLTGLLGNLPQPAAWLSLLQSQPVSAALRALIWPGLPVGLVIGLPAGLLGGWVRRYLIRRGWPQVVAGVVTLFVTFFVTFFVAVFVAAVMVVVGADAVADVVVVVVAFLAAFFVADVRGAGVVAVVVVVVAFVVAGVVAFAVAGDVVGVVVDVVAGDVTFFVAGDVAGDVADVGAFFLAFFLAFFMAFGVALDVGFGVAFGVARGVAAALRRCLFPSAAGALAAIVASASAGPLAASWAALVVALVLNTVPPDIPWLACVALGLGLVAGSRRTGTSIFDLSWPGLGARLFIPLSGETSLTLLPQPAAAGVWLAAWAIGFTRLPFYLWHSAALWFAQRRLAAGGAPRFAPWRWDELIRFPLPGLADYLTRFSQQQHGPGLQLIEEAAASWRQAGPAQRALLQLTAAELAQYDSEVAIARADDKLNWLPPALPESAQATLARFRAVSRHIDGKLKLSDAEGQLAQLARATAELDDLIKGLTFVPRRERELFLPVAQAWRETLRRASTSLPNPYIAGDPVSGDYPGLFVGRDDLVRELEIHLKNRSRRPTLVLYGQRRMGKTSLLYQLPRCFGPDVVPARVDCQAGEMQESNGAFLFNLARAIHREAAAQRQLELPPLPEGAGELSFTAFSLWLEAVEAQLSGRILLLCLDEYETIGEAIRLGRLDERILGLLRNLIQHHPAVTLLLAGSHHPAELDRLWSSYLISAAVLPISYLPADEVRRLVTQPIPGFPLRYTPEAVEHIIALTRCQPLLVQLLCQQVVILLNRRGERQADVADIKTAVPGALESGGTLYFTYLRQYEAAEAGDGLLRELAQRGPGVGASVAALTGGDPAREQALATLLRRDVLEEVDGMVRFEVELVRRWWLLPTSRL